MSRGLLATALFLLLAAPARPQQGVINLSCVEALSAIGEADLAGVFAFVAEKDSAAAFSDLLARNPKALGKFVAKVEKDRKVAQGISAWDKTVLQGVSGLFSSPLADTLSKPGSKLLAKVSELTAAPAMTLQEITARRRAGS